MKKAWILGLLAALMLLCGCGQQEDRHPEWAELVRFGNLLAAQTPEGFAPGQYNDTLSAKGIWYAAFDSGEEEKAANAEGKEISIYDAQIFLLVTECRDEAEARANVKDWTELEGRNYEAGELRELQAAGQEFSLLPLLSGKAENPYTHGAAAFAVRGSLAISAELLCRDGFSGDPEAVLETFLNGIRYGE